jgi:rhamnulose-1-phosphate aldolase
MTESINEAWFMRAMIKATSDMWLKGWNERNGGNISLRLLPEDLLPFRHCLKGEREFPIGENIPELSGQCFLVTGTGKYFRNVQLDPEENLGLVQVGLDGASVRILWGYSDGCTPTSELSAHLKSHRARQRVTQGRSRVIMHCHQSHRAFLRTRSFL